MFTTIIIVTVFIAVASLVGGVALMFRSNVSSAVEDRLQMLAGNAGAGISRDAQQADSQVLAQPLNDLPSALEQTFAKVLNLRRFIDQAGLRLDPNKFLLVVGAASGIGALIWFFTGLPIYVLPVAVFVPALVPFVWLFLKRRSRFKKFQKQLPDALDLIGRALRSGHSLASGFKLVADEMPEPICIEFGRCYEEQNLGIPLDNSLEDMTDRVPSMDLRFFATAVIMQRQTGGDLAELLDKIGRLIRERFQVWGQIQALTGEGRLSGIVLMALPIGLFFILLYMKPDYVMKLFNEPLGQQMMAAAIVMQIIGALVIKKIVDIKV